MGLMNPISNEEIAVALVKSRGNLHKASTVLKMPYVTLWRRVTGSKDLQKVQEQAKEETLEYVEAKLMKAIEDGNLKAIFFYLKCQGKKRGWVEKKIHEGNPENPIQIVLKPAFEKQELPQSKTVLPTEVLPIEDVEDAIIVDTVEPEAPQTGRVRSKDIKNV